AAWCHGFPANLRESRPALDGPANVLPLTWTPIAAPMGLVPQRSSRRPSDVLASGKASPRARPASLAKRVPPTSRQSGHACLAIAPVARACRSAQGDRQETAVRARRRIGGALSYPARVAGPS